MGGALVTSAHNLHTLGAGSAAPFFFVFFFFRDFLCTHTSTRKASNLGAVVEVVPVGAGTDPVVVGGGIVGLVVGVRALEVEGAGLGVELGSLVVETGSGGAVEDLEHLDLG